MYTMSQTKLCRLCVKVCTDYASLYNETGQKNNIYERTLKYFDPMFLNADQVHGSAVLCLECCGHISVFYNFQQAVFEAQRRLREGEREIEFAFKRKKTDELILDNKDNSHVTVTQDDSISLPDLELAEEFLFADKLQNEDNQVNSQTVREPKPLCEKTKEDTEQSEDHPLSIPDTSESENVSNSGDKQPKTTRKRKRNADEPIPLFKKTEEFGDKDDKIIINKLDTEHSEDLLLNTSDKGSVSDGNQRKTRKKRKHKRIQKLLPKEFDAVIAQWKPSLDCVVCKKSVASFVSLRKHFKREHPNEKCRVECCGRKLYARNVVAQHARFHFDPDKVKCKMCDSYFPSLNWMHAHMRIVHFSTNIEISDKMGNSKLKSKSSIECVICKTSCAEFSLLKEHYRLQHPTEICYALCCERKFYWPCRFESHMRLHRDPNAFKCKICGKILCTPETLNQHMRRGHSNIKTADP